MDSNVWLTTNECFVVHVDLRQSRAMVDGFPLLIVAILDTSFLDTWSESIDSAELGCCGLIPLSQVKSLEIGSYTPILTDLNNIRSPTWIFCY